ncbi:MAG: helicase-related protein [Candidatus Andersenbacteria bacterium]|nr:helicase-related protein [bacterium]MDZ4225703.1 helicase-related protein [Candidatus Andersenbacteria bacterium]
MNTAQDNCQLLSTNLQENLMPFIEYLKNDLTANDNTAKTDIPIRHLPLFLAYINTFFNRIFAIVDTGPQRAQKLSIITSQWSSLLNVKNNCQLISDTLNQAETSGDVVSSLSQTYHRLLLPQNQEKNIFILPIDKLDIAIPDPAQYQNNIITITVGEPTTLSQLTEALIKTGYHRYREQLSGPGLQIIGEQMHIKHPLLTGYYAITFYGSSIEKIVHHHARRAIRQHRLNIPPASFSQSRQNITSILSSFLLIRPAHSPAPNHTKNIIYNAIGAHRLFPFQQPSNPMKVLSSPNNFLLYTNHDRVANFLKNNRLSVKLCSSPLATNNSSLVGNNLAVVCEQTLFPSTDKQKNAPLSYQQGLALISDLRVGRPAVHSDHGIGIYEGLQTRTISHQTREYLVLRYAQGDSLSVPVEYAHKVTGYLGDTTPVLNRLGGNLWFKTKKSAQHDAAKFARELLDLAARRSQSTANQYIIDSELEKKLADSFPYKLTPDQLRAWLDIQDDLVSPRHLDRLIVGDVGFGKTELALRTARHAVNNNKQVAILAPTTLLVQQHVDNFHQRLADIADQIGVLSRFSSPSQQTATKRQITAGSLKIIIGTHALLSPSIDWQNLGLVIIDEEQRFGVKQKEHFKKIRAHLDVLALTATPIPRTLSMALTGLKQLSVISTPPAGRRSIKSFVCPLNDQDFARALNTELVRHGQIYIIAPKIRQLHALAHQVNQLAPQAKLAIAHGRMPAKQLSDVMSRFDNQDIDVLVSSSIIENGLDLPHANTIIIVNATHFGLADLYQLRGRVGRRQRQGYAYFFYDQHKLSEQQRRRLTALIEASRLGSGWSLAQKDLEIRGAGSLLGAEQSGTVNAVGIQLYLDLIKQAADRMEDNFIPRRDVDILLPLPAFIPPPYVADPAQRALVYQKMSRADSPKNLELELSRLIEQYGPLPPEVNNLRLVILLQHAASKAGISRLESTVITPPDEDPYTKIFITTASPPAVLRKIGGLGNWQVIENKLVLVLDAVTPKFISQLIAKLLNKQLT